MSNVASPARREARALKRVSSLVLNSPDHPVRRPEAEKGSATETISRGDARVKSSRQLSEEIVPDSEEERLR
jgi:hypothetical protein